jgi:UDP-glucuronate decarboxylase
VSRILVTGGAGFIGSHLCERLLAGGDEVVCLDNFFTGARANVEHLLEHHRFELVRHDVTQPIIIEVDQIYHLACPASPIHYQRNPVRTIRTAVHGTLNMLDMAREVRARILIASTSEIYGDPQEHPQTEAYWGNVNPTGPRACYDAETDILTKDGWVRFPDLSPGVEVATLNAAGAVEYHVPHEIISYPYVGRLKRFVNAKLDLCLTPNHRLYVKGKTGKHKFVRADEDRCWHGWRAPSSAVFGGEDVEWMEFGEPPRNAKTRLGRVRMDDWLEFFGYYVSEGCVHVRRRVRQVGGRDYDVADHNVLIAQQDPVGRAKIDACLTRLGWTFFDSDHHQFRICSSQLVEHLAPLGKAGDKYLPRQYLRLSPRQSRILLDALILGDGSRRDNGAIYYTKSRRLADDVQELALRAGYAASLSSTEGRELYRVNIRRVAYANLPEPEDMAYAGSVYCVDVPNHVICVRRSGRAVWCGNCYDEGKRCAEALTVSYARQYGVETRIARIFNTYGPRMHENDGRVVSNFVLQALRGEPITIYGQGQQTRSFCYVSDLVTAFMKFMALDADPGPINLGNPHEQTIEQLARMIIGMTGSRSTLRNEPLPVDDPVRRKPDITKARQILGWEPAVTIEEGLSATIEDFRGRTRGGAAVSGPA